MRLLDLDPVAMKINHKKLRNSGIEISLTYLIRLYRIKFE